MATKTPRANTASVLTSAISDDVRQSHIAAIQGLGAAIEGARAGKDIAEAVVSAITEARPDYDWTAKSGRTTAVTMAVHLWATGTDDAAQWPAMTRAAAEGKRVRTRYATGVDAIAKHVRAMVKGDDDTKTTDWLNLLATAALNASNNGHTLEEIVARVYDTVGEATDDDATIGTALTMALNAVAASRLALTA